MKFLTRYQLWLVGAILCSQTLYAGQFSGSAQAGGKLMSALNNAIAQYPTNKPWDASFGNADFKNLKYILDTALSLKGVPNGYTEKQWPKVRSDIMDKTGVDINGITANFPVGNVGVDNSFIGELGYVTSAIPAVAVDPNAMLHPSSMGNVVEALSKNDFKKMLSPKALNNLAQLLHDRLYVDWKATDKQALEDSVEALNQLMVFDQQTQMYRQIANRTPQGGADFLKAYQAFTASGGLGMAYPQAVADAHQLIDGGQAGAGADANALRRLQGDNAGLQVQLADLRKNLADARKDLDDCRSKKAADANQDAQQEIQRMRLSIQELEAKVEAAELDVVFKEGKIKRLEKDLQECLTGKIDDDANAQAAHKKMQADLQAMKDALDQARKDLDLKTANAQDLAARNNALMADLRTLKNKFQNLDGDSDLMSEALEEAQQKIKDLQKQLADCQNAPGGAAGKGKDPQKELLKALAELAQKEQELRALRGQLDDCLKNSASVPVPGAKAAKPAPKSVTPSAPPAVAPKPAGPVTYTSQSAADIQRNAGAELNAMRLAVAEFARALLTFDPETETAPITVPKISNPQGIAALAQALRQNDGQEASNAIVKFLAQAAQFEPGTELTIGARKTNASDLPLTLGKGATAVQKSLSVKYLNKATGALPAGTGKAVVDTFVPALRALSILAANVVQGPEELGNVPTWIAQAVDTFPGGHDVDAPNPELDKAVANELYKLTANANALAANLAQLKDSRTFTRRLDATPPAFDPNKKDWLEDQMKNAAKAVEEQLKAGAAAMGQQLKVGAAATQEYYTFLNNFAASQAETLKAMVIKPSGKIKEEQVQCIYSDPTTGTEQRILIPKSSLAQLGDIIGTPRTNAEDSLAGAVKARYDIMQDGVKP